MILDTNAYSALLRGKESVSQVVSNAHELYLPLPVIAELRYGFLKGSQSERNEQVLQNFLAQPQISIVFPTLKTTDIYAKLHHLCQQKGRALSQNDIWIAALAQENKYTLITFDKDFKVFKGIFDNKLLILS